jgi:hypothetical protein
MKTNAGGFGTNTSNIGPGIVAYLAEHGVSSQFTVNTVMAPNFTYVENQVEQCNDVVLVLGFYSWNLQPPPLAQWTRMTYPFPVGVGHCVTVAGINSTSSPPEIAISDPWNDTAVYGLSGVFYPSNHPGPGAYNGTLHNNASFVSHDEYTVDGYPPGSPGQWGLHNYGFPYKNISNVQPAPPATFPVALVEAAVITSPSPPAVGGVWVPVDKLSLLAPYIALASTIILAVVATDVLFKRKKK